MYLLLIIDITYYLHVICTVDNSKDRLAAVDHLLEDDEDLAEKEAQEGFLDFRLLRLHDDHMLVDAVRKNLAQIRQRKQIKTPDHRVRKSIIDFTSRGYYHRFGAKEKEVLALFDFLDDYDVETPTDESDETEVDDCILPSPLTPPLTHSNDTFNPESTSGSPQHENKSGDDVAAPIGHKYSSQPDRKALTPDFSPRRKLEHSSEKTTGDVSIYATPGLRKKKITVKAASNLAEDTKVSKEDSLQPSGKPKSTILKNEIVNLAKTEIGMKVANDLHQEGKLRNIAIPDTDTQTSQHRKSENSPLINPRRVTEDSPSKKYVVNLTTRRKVPSQSSSTKGITSTSNQYNSTSTFLTQSLTSTEL